MCLKITHEKEYNLEKQAKSVKFQGTNRGQV